MMFNIEKFFFLISNDVRLRCLHLLMAGNELCVCEIMSIVNLPQTKISKHLALLYQHNLIKNRRDKKWIYYRMSDELPPFAKNMIEMIGKELTSIEPYCSDLSKLKKMQKSCSEVL